MNIYLEDFEWQIKADGKPYGALVKIDQEVVNEKELDELLQVICEQIKRTLIVKKRS